MSPTRPRRPVQGRPGSLLLALGVGALTLALAACGSQLDPDEVAAVSGQDGGVAQDGTRARRGRLRRRRRRRRRRRTAAPPPSGGGTTSGSGGGTDGGGVTEGTGQNSATGGGKGGSCDGFKNGPGITDSTITIGNSSDISGPVPGLFEQSQEAVKAYVAYFNATSDICGRKLELKAYDSRTDAAADQQSYTKACDETFAMIGSMSAFDSGGSSTAEGCGLPDLRTAAVTGDRVACGDLLRRPVHGLQRVRERRPRLRHQEPPRRRRQRRDALHQRRRGRRERQDPGRGDGQARHELRVRPGHRRLGVQLRALRPADEGQGHRVRPDDRRARPVRAAAPRP